MFISRTKSRLISLLRWFFTSRGLIILLLSGITVQLIGNGIEDSVKKQRYLELLEYEIKSHIITAASLSVQFKDGKEPMLNKFIIPTRFYHSVLNSGYLTSIDPDLFLEITIYYDLIDAHFNDSLNWAYSTSDNLRLKWTECGASASQAADFDVCNEHKRSLDNANKQLSQGIINTWVNAAHWITEHKIDEKFNPTKERRRSPLLMLLMGNKALMFLSE